MRIQAIGAVMGILMCFLAGPAEAVRPSLKVFYTANARGYIDQCGCRYSPAGGIARRATFLRASTDSLVPQLVFDGGEVLGYNDPREELKTRYLFRAMERMGYKTIGVGPHDLGYGLGFLRQAEERYGFTFTSANIVDQRTNEPVFPPYVLERVGQYTIGIISVIGHDRMPRTTRNDVVPGLVDAVSSVSNAVAMIGNSADLVVLSAYANSATLDTLKAIDGIDIVLVARPMRVPGNRWVHGGRRPIMGYQTYQGKGVIWIRLDMNSSGTITDAQGDMLLLTAEVADDPEMAALKEEYEAAAEELGGEDH